MRSGVTLLLDRDGTLVHDIPYNNDPEQLHLVDGVIESLELIRARGIPVAIVSNQSGIERGLTTHEEVADFNLQLSEEIGGFDLALICPHLDGCDCRKPAPGLLVKAMEVLGATPEKTVMVGDIGSDIAAAQAAGVHSILVPNEMTEACDVEAAEIVRPTFASAMAAVCAFHDTGRLR